MRNKTIVLKNIESLKGSTKNLQFFINRQGSMNDINKTLQDILDKITTIEELVDLEQDPFKNDQIL